MVFEIVKNRKSPNLKEIIFSPSNYLLIFIFIIYVVSFLIKFIYCNNEDKLYSITSTTYLDTYTLALWFNRVFFVESLLFAAVSVKLLNFFKFIDYINLFYSVIIRSCKILSKFALFYTAILVVFACIATITWGPYSQDYDNLGSSFLNILLLTIGFINIHVMMSYDSGWTVVFLLTLFIFIMFFMFSIFIAVFSETERNVVTHIGYPQDNKYTSWQLRDYIVWLCFFVKRDNKEEKNNS